MTAFVMVAVVIVVVVLAKFTVCGEGGEEGGGGGYDGGDGGEGCSSSGGGQVKIHNKPLLTSSTLPTPQIPAPRIPKDKFFLTMPASLTPSNTATTIPPILLIPYHYHNHPYNPINSTTTMAQHTPNYSNYKTTK